MASSGRGKQSFREFTRTANETKRLILAALKSGEQYTTEDLDGWYEDLIDAYENDIRDNDIPNGDLWIARSNDKVEQHKIEITSRYPNIQSSDFGTDEDDSSGGSEHDEPTHEQDNVLGIPIITAEECTGNGNSQRGQIIPTYEELIEYLEPIPPSVIMGLIPVFRDGNLVGWRLCAAKET